MRNYLPLAALLLFLALGCGKSETRAFFVEGSCPECQAPIEALLKAQTGVQSADWDYASSLATVRFQAGRTGEEQLQRALAAAGFSTGYFEADTLARKKLPPCCQESIPRKLKPASPQHE
jgi:copper chaperone CopZ